MLLMERQSTAQLLNQQNPQRDLAVVAVKEDVVVAAPKAMGDALEETVMEVEEDREERKMLEMRIRSLHTERS